ncbi:MAG: BrnA antitoxin family protein [Spirochaeta sp.]
MKTIRGFSPLTEEQKRRFKKLSQLPDSAIDTSDINEWSDEDFAEAKPFLDVYKPKKQQITARIDIDVLMWLKSHGKGYQTLMNDLLRKCMLEELNQDV